MQLRKTIFSVLFAASVSASPPQSDKGRFVIFASSGQMVGVQIYFAVPYAKPPRCVVYSEHAVVENTEKDYVQIITPVGEKVNFICEERK